jgi:hypothetical protein
MERRGFLIGLSIAAAGLSGVSRAAETKPTDAEAKAIEALEKAGGSVRRIAQGDDRLEVDFHLGGPSLTNDGLKPVAQLTNVVDLHLGGTAIDDGALEIVGGLTALTRLHLEKTAVTDKGLGQLKKLANLEYLNLYGTAVTDAGLKQLAGLTKLKNLYLWQTKVSESGVKALQAALPGLSIDSGWDLAETQEIKKEKAPADPEKKAP